jgi:hypothetical protein
MDPQKYEEKYKKSLSRSRSLGTADFMEQAQTGVVFASLGTPGIYGNQSGTTSSGMTITTNSNLPQATAYTLTSALGMK